MPSGEDEAICIRHWDFSETSQTVGLFSRRRGMIRAIAKGARRERGGHSGGVDLLTRGSMTVSMREGSDLATLTMWDLLEVFSGIRQDMTANRMAFYGADLVGRFFQPLDPHERAYDALVALLRSLGSKRLSTIDQEVLLLTFQWVILQEAGYQPRLGVPEAGAEVLHFEPREGGTIVDRESATSWKVRPTTIDLLRGLGDGTVSVATPAGCDGVTRANRLLAAFLREILGEEPFTMRNLFGDLQTRTS